MRTIHLYGDLQRHAGSRIDLNVQTAGEAIAALCANFPDFTADIRKGSWVIMRGDPETGMVLDEDMVPSLRLGSADLHIMPEISGGKRDGLMKAILGVTLLVASGGSAAFLATPIAGTMFGGATWAAAMGQVGLAMALAGVSSLLTPQSDSSGDDEESFVMSGPKSSYGQGKAIQIIYGEIITGGMLISGGVDTIGLQTVSDTYHPNTDPESVADTSASFQTAGA